MEPQQDFICFLEVINAQGLATERKKVYINASWISIGRDTDADFCIDFNDKVSPIHAKIEITKEGIFLYDNKSASGTFINEQRISGRTAIGLGTIFSVAGVKLRLSSVDDIQNSRVDAKPKHTPYNAFIKSIPQKTSSEKKGTQQQNADSQKTKKTVKISLGWALFLLLLPLYIVTLYKNNTNLETNESLENKNIASNEFGDDVDIIATFAYVQDVKTNSDDSISYFVIVTNDLRNHYAVRLENKQQEEIVKEAFLQKSIIRIVGTIERLERGFLIISKQKTKKYILAAEVNIEKED